MSFDSEALRERNPTYPSGLTSYRKAELEPYLTQRLTQSRYAEQGEHDVVAQERRYRALRDPQPLVGVGLLEHMTGDRQSLGFVSIQERFGGCSVDDQCQLPAQVVAALDAGVHALPAGRAMDM